MTSDIYFRQKISLRTRYGDRGQRNAVARRIIYFVAQDIHEPASIIQHQHCAVIFASDVLLRFRKGYIDVDAEGLACQQSRICRVSSSTYDPYFLKCERAFTHIDAVLKDSGRRAMICAPINSIYSKQVRPPGLSSILLNTIRDRTFIDAQLGNTA